MAVRIRVLTVAASLVALATGCVFPVSYKRHPFNHRAQYKQYKKVKYLLLAAELTKVTDTDSGDEIGRAIAVVVDNPVKKHVYFGGISYGRKYKSRVHVMEFRSLACFKQREPGWCHLFPPAEHIKHHWNRLFVYAPGYDATEIRKVDEQYVDSPYPQTVSLRRSNAEPAAQVDRLVELVAAAIEPRYRKRMDPATVRSQVTALLSEGNRER